MAAKLATVDERLLARMEEAADVLAGSIIARSSSDTLQADAMQFDCGYLSPYFITDPELMEVVLENVYVLIQERKISFKMDLLPLLEQISKSGKPLLIIAEDVEGEALATLVVNKLNGALQVAAVRAPRFGDQRTSMVQDIVRLTGSKAITGDFHFQLKNIQICDLGHARKVTINKHHTIVEGRSRCEQLSCGPEPDAYPNVHASPVQSSGTQIWQAPTGMLSVRANSLDRLLPVAHSVCDVRHHTQEGR
jgi:chaperonin GroEL (HSP60 family)